jgi:hypothetical protein
MYRHAEHRRRRRRTREKRMYFGQVVFARKRKDSYTVWLAAPEVRPDCRRYRCGQILLGPIHWDGAEDLPALLVRNGVCVNFGFVLATSKLSLG